MPVAAASLGSCVQLARPAAPRASSSKPRRSKISPKQLTPLLSSADDAHPLLRAYSRHNASVAPIPVGAFNREGNIFAYAVSYDWSKGSEHYNPRTNHLLLHPVPDQEIKSRSNQKKTFGARR